MASTVINIPASTIGPNTPPTAGQNIPAGTTGIQAAIVSPDWFNVAFQPGVLTYRVDFLVSGVWKLGPSFTAAFGETRRGDGVTMPTIKFGADQLAGATQVRASVQANPSIRVGATITVFS